MAPLYGRLTGNYWNRTLTRRGHYSVESRLETWEGCVWTVLKRDGSFYVYTGEKHNPNNLIARGNVNERRSNGDRTEDR